MSGYALITGASSGIGRELAEEAAKDGYDLVLVSGDEGKLNEAVIDLSAKFPSLEIVAISRDLARPESPQEIYEKLKEKGIFIYILVNDAGIGHNQPFIGYEIETDINMIRLNVEAVVRMCKLFVPGMIAREGKVLNVGSIAGFQPGPLLAIYHSTKAFVNSFSEALAEELKDTSVTVTCLCPGPTDTEFFDRAEMEDAKIVQKGPLMNPKEVAAAGWRAMMDGERTYIPGLTNKALTFVRRVLPKSVQAKINKKMYESIEEDV